MAYAFFKQEKRHDRETMYIAYMMIGSMFAGTRVTNEVAEQQLYLHYREMSVAEQERKERSVLQQAEQGLKGQLGRLADMRAEVSISLGDEYSYLIFRTGFESILVRVTRNGEMEITFYTE